MNFPSLVWAVAACVTILAGAPAQAVTIVHETEANDTMGAANFIAAHDGSIDIYGFQASDHDWFAFHGSAGDRLTLEVQDEGPNPDHPSTHQFDSVMALHTSMFQLAWDDDDDTNIDDLGDDLPQRVRDKFGSYIERNLTETGMYYVRLESFGLTDTETYNYRLVVRGLTPNGLETGTVPLPAGLPLLVTALGLVGLILRRRAA